MLDWLFKTSDEIPKTDNRKTGHLKYNGNTESMAYKPLSWNRSNSLQILVTLPGIFQHVITTHSAKAQIFTVNTNSHSLELVFGRRLFCRLLRRGAGDCAGGIKDN
jgi:hypothetical protein